MLLGFLNKTIKLNSTASNTYIWNEFTRPILAGRARNFFSGGVENAHEWKSIMVFFCSLLVENTKIKNGFPSFTWVRHDVTI